MHEAKRVFTDQRAGMNALIRLFVGVDGWITKTAGSWFHVGGESEPMPVKCAIQALWANRRNDQQGDPMGHGKVSGFACCRQTFNGYRKSP